MPRHFFVVLTLFGAGVGLTRLPFKGANTTHDFIGRAFKLVFAVVVAVVVLYSFTPHVYWYTLPINSLQGTRTRSIGVGLLFLSLVWTVIAQAQMGQSWRIGIDAEHRTPLVQSGVFGVSRNPIFLGMQVTLLGLFLVIPSAVTLITLLSGIVLIGMQVRLEEEYLKKTHGEVYTEYCRSVRRWI